MDRNILPPGLAGYVAAQNQNQQAGMNQIQQLGGLLQLQGSIDARNEQAALKNSVVMTPDGQMDARATLSNLYKISPAIGLKFQQALQKETQFAKVDPKDYTPESVAAFARTGSHADLVPRVKREAVQRGNVVDFVNPYEQNAPLPIGVSPNTQATLAQSQNQFNATLPIQQANAGANLTNTFYNTGMGPTPVPGAGFSPAQIQASTAPAAPAAPLPASRTPTPANFPRVLPSEQAMRDAVAGRIQTAEQNGGAGMIPTANVVQGSQPPSARALPQRLRDEAAAKAAEPVKPTAESLKQTTGVKNTLDAISTYREALKGFGITDILNPAARAKIGTAYNNMLLQAKEAYNLGVLNGPDYQILQEVITNPNSFMGAITPKAAMNDQLDQLEKIMSRVAQSVQQVQQSKGGTRQTYVAPGTQLDAKGWGIREIK